MLDRQKLEALLSRRFAGATSDQIAAAANAIMGLDDEAAEAERGADLEPRASRTRWNPQKRENFPATP